MDASAWPYNLWSDIIDSGRFAAKAEDGSDLDYVLYWPNLEAVLSSALDERHQRVLRMRYEQNLSYRSIGEELGVGPERIRQLIVHSLRKLREPRNFFRLNATPERNVIKLRMELRDMTEKYNSLKVQVDNLVDEIEAKKAKKRAELPLDSPIASLELSMRSFNCLRANNIETVHSETKNNYFAERNSIMKNMTSAIFYMSEWQAIFQCEEYSFSEARPFQDKQENMVGLMP